MTDADRLAAALHGWLLHDGPCPTPDKCADLMTADMTDAAAVLRADPTLICPDPEAHALADAVRRLPEDWSVERSNDGWHVYANDQRGVCIYHAPTLEAAITAALEDQSGKQPCEACGHHAPHDSPGKSMDGCVVDVMHDEGDGPPYFLQCCCDGKTGHVIKTRGVQRW